MINTVYHLLVKDKQGRERGRVNREGGLINFLPLKREGELEGGGLFSEGEVAKLRIYDIKLLLSNFKPRGAGSSPFIMGETKSDPHSQKEHIEVRNILLIYNNPPMRR